jgi:CO/xanthine dehydrogenase Mo-binding subunit
MRAPGEAVGTFGLECAIDELADRLGVDPIELRLRNEPEKTRLAVHHSRRATLWRLISRARLALDGTSGASPARGAKVSSSSD